MNPVELPSDMLEEDAPLYLRQWWNDMEMVYYEITEGNVDELDEELFFVELRSLVEPLTHLAPHVDPAPLWSLDYQLRRFALKNPRKQPTVSVLELDLMMHNAELSLLRYAASFQGIAIDPSEMRTLTSTETAVLEYVKALSKRETGEQIAAHFNEQHGENRGESTVRNALSFLTRNELISNRRDDHGRGYGPVSW